MTENDPAIRVNIRTGTSTRVPQPPPRERWSSEGESYNGLITLMTMVNGRPYQAHANFDVRSDIINEILERSMQDGELKRNPRIQADVQARKCSASEVAHECAICQTKFQLDEEICSINCGHCFHAKCLQEWVKYKPECPLCRDIIPVLEN